MSLGNCVVHEFESDLSGGFEMRGELAISRRKKAKSNWFSGRLFMKLIRIDAVGSFAAFTII